MLYYRKENLHCIRPFKIILLCNRQNKVILGCMIKTIRTEKLFVWKRKENDDEGYDGLK